ncbi:hypothetical protein HPB48_019559 [Haemaphysalis longicornis]|uniref:Uncharacterized protein n=1 Tax=Haemaphysalis longicornis TaxID=44386 RepID=A0A9J6FPY3_HAELO|nr:hypothetical protein HPB48_019559 [Haemaphysalis longicornis]
MPHFFTQLLEAPRCRHRGPATPQCPNAAVNGEPTDICGTARMNLSTFGNLRNAYPYLLAEMTLR